MKTYDVVVVGLGIMGSAAAYSLAKRGVRVLGVDANPPHHALGSSHGPTRATRETYFEAPDYVPLARRSTELWRLLETESGASLLDIKGGLYLAPAGHPLLEGVGRAAALHGLALETLDRREGADRFPGFSLPEGWQILGEEGAGILQAPACLDAFRDQARLCGAELRFQQSAVNWRQRAGGVVVDIGGQQVSAAKIVLALGPWACDRAAGLNLPLIPGGSPSSISTRPGQRPTARMISRSISGQRPRASLPASRISTGSGPCLCAMMTVPPTRSARCAGW